MDDVWFRFEKFLKTIGDLERIGTKNGLWKTGVLKSVHFRERQKVCTV